MRSMGVVLKIFLCMFTVFSFKRVARAGYGDYGGWGMVTGNDASRLGRTERLWVWTQLIKFLEPNKSYIFQSRKE